MTKIKAIIFDVNGVFTNATYLSQRVNERFGVDKDLFWGKLKGIYDIAKTNQPKPADLWDPLINLININKNDFFNFWFSGETLNQPLLDFVKELKNNGYKIFILSNNIKERKEYYQKNFPELFEAFDAVYFSWETGFAKPDLNAFKNILSTHNLKPEECIFFDDQQKNIDAAASMGIKSHLYEGLGDVKKFIQNETR